jgi:hypothetical protein
LITHPSYSPYEAEWQRHNGENRSLVLLLSGDRNESAYRQISYSRLGTIVTNVSDQLLATKPFRGAANKPRRN